MKKYSIAVLPGDGIGVDVTREAVKVLKTVQEIAGDLQFEFKEFPWGTKYYSEHGVMMPGDALSTLSSFEGILLGAVGDPSVPDHVTLWGMLLPIRQSFQQYVNLRPVRLLNGIKGPLKNKTSEHIDMVFVRENTEGEYAGVGGRIHQGTAQETALQTAVFTRVGCERIMKYAFELAMKEERKHVTSVTKSNACNYSMVFWDEVFKVVAGKYNEVKTTSILVDAMAAYLITHPERFSIVVASNLFGDILTDIGSAIMGSIGLGASANIDPSGRYPSMFEPVHGSAPDIQGKGIANPIGAIWSVKLLLEHLGEIEMANIVMQAIEKQIGTGVVTVDLEGSAKTWEVGDGICAKILNNAQWGS